MKKIIISILFMNLLFITSSNAAVYKGQKIYIKKCKKCHNSGMELASLKKKKEWKKLMKSKGKKLAEIHIDNKKVLKNKNGKKTNKYFKSKKYIKRAKHLKDFLTEYAKDSGNVPACN